MATEQIRIGDFEITSEAEGVYFRNTKAKPPQGIFLPQNVWLRTLSWFTPANAVSVQQLDKGATK